VAVQQVVQFVPPRRKRERRERVHSHLVVMRGGSEEHRDSSYWLRTYSREEWMGLIERSALRYLGVADESGRRAIASGSGYAVWVLGKREAGER
jgi:hypothetical protein